METSFSQTSSFICSKCNTTFEVHVWLIVDTVARSDLLAHILNGTLNERTCPNCEQRLSQIDVPLLLYSPDRTPTLLFSPAQQLTADQTVEQAGYLLSILHKYLNNNWNDAWLQQGLRIISRSLLPIIFSLDPEAIVYMTDEQIASELEAKDSQGFDTYSLEQEKLTLKDDADSNVPLEFRDDLRQAFEAENHYHQNGDLAALVVNIAALENLLNKPNLMQYSLYASILNYAGSAYLRRYGIVKQMEDLERTIQILNNGVKHISMDSPLLSNIYNDLGSALQMCYNRQGQVEDLELAVVNYQKAVGYITNDSFGDVALYQINLGKGLFARYELLGQLEDLEEAIKICQAALEATLPDSPNFADHLNTLGSILLAHYSHHKMLEVLDQAILILQTAVECITGNSPDVSAYFTNLGTSLYTRYNRLEQLEDLDRAIVAAQKALEYNLKNSPEMLSATFTDLAMRLSIRYERSRQLEDLENAIEAYQEALRYIPNTSPLFFNTLNNLSAALWYHYQRVGALEDLDQAIVAAQTALEYRSNVPPEELSIVLSTLGCSLRSRYEHHGQVEDLENAIKVDQEAVQYIPDTSPSLPGTLSGLGCSLRDLYEHSGRLEDLERAIEVFQKAVHLTPTDLSLFSRILTNLGVCLQIRYKHTGMQENLEEAIEVLEKALQIIPDDLLDLPTIILDALGVCLHALYRSTGKLENLDRAIATHQEAVKQASVNTLAMSGRFFSNLGTALRNRYRHRKQIEDLEQALTVHQEAVNQTPASSPELPEFLSTLSMGFYERYRHLKKAQDLERAIATIQRCIELAPINSPNLSVYFSFLGNIMRVLYEHSGRLEDLEQVVTAYHKAVELAPDDSLELPGFLANLGTSLRDRHKHTKKQKDMHWGIALYERACQKGWQIDINAVLGSAYNWISWAIERKSWTEAIQAYTYGKQAIEQLYRTQLLRTNQETWLNEARDMYIKAAYAMARVGKLSDAALTLEHSRARGLNEALARDRADLGRIQSEDQEIYRLYQQITERLRQLERMEREESSLTMKGPMSLVPPVFFNQIQEAREELTQVIIHIRQIPGHEDFLAEPIYHNIVSAVRPAVPLVYLATTSVGSFALLINAARAVPEVIWIDDFFREDLESLLVGDDDQKDEINQGYLLGQLFNTEGLNVSLVGILSHLGKKLVHSIANRLEELGVKGNVDPFVKTGGKVIVRATLLLFLSFCFLFYNKKIGFTVEYTSAGVW